MQAELVKTRNLVLAAAILYPAWTGVQQMIQPGVTDSIWERLAVGLLMILNIFIAKFAKTSDENKLSIMRMGRWIITTHYFTVIARNEVTFTYAMCAFFMVFLVSILFNSRKWFAIYSVYILSLTFLCGKGDKDFPIYFFQAGIFCTQLIAYLGLSLRLTLIDNLRSNEAIFRSMFQNSLMGMMVMDLRGTITMVNETMCGMLGRYPEEMVGQPIGNWVIAEDRVILENKIHRLLKGEDSLLSLEYRYLTLEGKEIWVKVSGNMIKAKGSPDLAFLVFENITEKIETENLLRAQHQKMFHTSKMTALGEMSGSLAHEINTPLAVIMMSIHNLKKARAKGTLTDEFMAESFDIVSSTIERITKIIQGLRKFSRDSSKLENEIVPVIDVINDCLNLSRETFANEQIELIVDPFPKDLLVKCRPIELSQVIINLLNNSKDAIRGRDEKWVRLSFSESNLQTMIEVTDSGPQIPREIQAKIFQPFFTTKPVGVGTGLGLSISIGIVQSFGGQLEYDTKSANCRFVIKLPRVMERDRARI